MVKLDILQNHNHNFSLYFDHVLGVPVHHSSDCILIVLNLKNTSNTINKFY